MNRTGARLTAYAAALAGLFAVSFGLGAAVGPVGSSQKEEARVSGLSSTEDGYSFVPVTNVLPPGREAEFRFQITGPDGIAVRSFQTLHEKELHLIVASLDLGWFSHVHPVRDEQGTWSVPLTVPAPGAYRAFADFAAAGGEPVVLGLDIAAPGAPQPQPLAPPSRVATVDGYEVTMAGAPDGPGDTDIALRVSREGRPVTDLEPYLGAFGHLVALRANDLAYLHVHPDGHPGDGHTSSGPEVRFGADFPTAGDYRLFFDFQHRGVVRTAAFTVSVPEAQASRRTATTAHGGRHAD